MGKVRAEGVVSGLGRKWKLKLKRWRNPIP